MKQEEFEKITNQIQEKIGKENSGLIADDLGLLLIDNSSMNEEFTKKDNLIKQLKNDKENLLKVNGNLLQQISMGEDELSNKSSAEDKKIIDFKIGLDEFGNFKD